MCIIFISDNPASRPTVKELKNSELANPDGIGIAYKVNDELVVLKNITLSEAIEINKTANGLVITHFRYTSSGETCDELTHPHPAGLDTEGDYQYLFHNGTVDRREWYQLLLKTDLRDLPDGEYSDSKALGIAVAQLGANVLNLFSDDNRFVLVSKNYHKTYGYWLNPRKGLKTSCFIPTGPRLKLKEDKWNNERAILKGY